MQHFDYHRPHAARAYTLVQRRLDLRDLHEVLNRRLQLHLVVLDELEACRHVHDDVIVHVNQPFRIGDVVVSRLQENVERAGLVEGQRVFVLDSLILAVNLE